MNKIRILQISAIVISYITILWLVAGSVSPNFLLLVAFCVLSVLIQLVFFTGEWKDVIISDLFYQETSIRIGMAYIVSQYIFTLIVLAIDHLQPIKAFRFLMFLEILIALFFILKQGQLVICKQHTDDYGKNLHQTLTLNLMADYIANIQRYAADDIWQRRIVNLSEEVQYSNPVPEAYYLSIEDGLRKEISLLEEAVISRNEEDWKFAADHILRMIQAAGF